MTQKIQGESPFQVLATNFSIGPSQQNYVLQISADGTNYSDLFTVSAGQTKMVTNVANGSYYRMKNNNSEVTINWRTQCNDGQGGGGGSYVLPPATQQTLGGVKVGNGLTVQADGTLSATGGSGSGSSYEPYKIELSNYDPQYFTSGDTAALNAFYAALVADPSIGDGAYIKCGDYIFNMVEYGAIVEGNGDFKFVMANSESIKELRMHFEDSEYVEGFLWENNFDGLYTTSVFPEFANAGHIVNFDDGETMGLFVFDGEDWVPFGGGDNSSLVPATEFPADPEEGQIVNYSDERLNVGVLYRYNGTNWEPYGGGDNTVLKSVSEFPESADTGDVVALAEHTEGLPYGITFNEMDYNGGDIQGRRLIVPFGSLDELGEGELVFIGNVGPVGGSAYELNISNADGVYCLTYEDPNDPLVSIYTDEEEYTDSQNGVVFEYYISGDTYVFDIYPDVNETNEIVFTEVPEDSDVVGVYQYDGSDWNAIGGGEGGSDFIHLDSIGITGEVGKTYEFEGRLMKWVEGSGYTAEWLKNIGQLSERYEGTGLIYAVIPNNTKLFEYKYPYGGEWRYVVYSGGTLYCTETGGTVVASASTGEEFNFPATQNGNIYQVRGIFKNGYIGFFKNGYISCQNVWDGSTNNGHFELIDKNNYPYIYNSGDGYIYGVNEKGQAVLKKQSFGTKIVYFNTTGYSNSMGYITNGTGNGPERVWVPTTGGLTGQTLVSAGDNTAPVWETRIKVVKITSDAYEALVQAGTTDPNTLYAIVDE